MSVSKNPNKVTQGSSGNNKFVVFLLFISLAANGYFLLHKPDKKQEALVVMGDQAFRWKDISDSGKGIMARLDNGYYTALKREADLWVENQIFPKEAQSMSIDVPELINQQIVAKVTVSKEDVYHRYVMSPQADDLAWPQVLTDIENELKGQAYQSVKANYLESLHAKYGVRYIMSSPGGDKSAPVFSSRFPEYKPMLSGVPLRGASQAPVLIEVYGDFMCPFSVRFSSTLKDLDRSYPDKLRIAFRHFPLPFHQGAHLMAEASACAEEQGKFWEYHDKLMAEAKKREKPELVQIANDLGLSSPKFVECLDSGRHVKKVDNDISVGRANGVQGTPGYLINGRRGSGAMPVESMKPLIAWHLNPAGVYPGKPKPPANQPAPGAPNQQPRPGMDPAKIYPLDAAWLKKGFSQGSENAPVTLVEFFDYNCPFCKKGAEVADALVAQYGSKLRRVSKHYPLPMHPNAAITSEALLCAHEQSKFMELRKEVLGESWGKSSVEDLKAAAKKVGLKQVDFDACLDSRKMKASVEEDMKMASSAGVQSTPTFIVNGTPVVGAQPIESFNKVIDEKLVTKK